MATKNKFRHMKKTIINTIILCCWAFSATTLAQSIGLRFPDTSMVQGDTIVLPLIVDSTLTGEEVYAFNLEISYDDYYFEFVKVSKADMTQGFGDFAINTSMSDKILISGASGTALAGTGELLYVHLKAIRTNWGAPISLYTTSILNEGSPTIIVTQGRISIAQAPSITISPNDAELLVGETQEFVTYGDTISPLIYEVENTSVGSIDADGLFTALAPGSTKVLVTGADGTTDMTNYNIEVFGVQLSSPEDLQEWQGSMIDIPVKLNNVSGTDLFSGSFKFSFNDYYLSYREFITTGSLLENAYVEVVSLDDDMLMVNFASAQAIVGDSMLLHLRFDISRSHTGYTYLNYSDILFNEDVLGMNKRGRFQTINYQNVTLYSTGNKYDLIAGEKWPLTYYGGIAPYLFESSDSTVASVSSTAEVSALKGGNVTFTATDSVGSQKTSNEFRIWDTYIEVPDTTGPEASIFLLPVYIGDILSGATISAFQINMTYRTPELDFLEVVKAGSLTEDWSLAKSHTGNKISISGANTDDITSGGVLFYLKFGFTDDFTINERVSVAIDDVLLNEGYPTALLRDGYITCVKPEDLLISKLISPVSDCDLGAAEDIVVEIMNNGYVGYKVGDTIMASYRVYYNNTVYDTIILSQDFPMKSVMNYTFKAQADFSQDNWEYSFEVQTELSSERDANPSNDRIYTRIFNFKNPSLDLGADIETCVQEPVVISAPTGFEHYEWSTGVMDTNAVSVDTTTMLWLKVTNDYGCTMTDTINVIIHPIPNKPEVSFSAQEACVGDTILLEAPAGYSAYKWTTGQVDSIITVIQSGEYGVMVYNEGMCMSDTSDLIDVMFYDRPMADFTYTNNGLTVSFTNFSQSATDYVWSFGDGDASTEENPTHTFSWEKPTDLKSNSLSGLRVEEDVFGYIVRLKSSNGVCDDYKIDTIPAELFASDTVYETLCEGEVFNYNDEMLSESGKYYRAYTDLTGKEIVEALFLTVASLYNDTISSEICEFDTYDFNGEMLSVAGFYTDTFVSVSGCDSIVCLDLSILEGRVDSIEATICEGTYYQLGSDTLWTAGVYTTDEPLEMSPTNVPCVRTVLTLSVEPAGFKNDTLTLCPSELPFDYNGHIFPVGTTSGVQFINLESLHGCVMEIMLDLTVLSGDSTYVIDYGEVCPNEVINDKARLDEVYDTTIYKNKCDYDSIVIHRWDMIYPPVIDILGAMSVVLNTPAVYSVESITDYVEWFVEDTSAVLSYYNDSSIEIVFSEVKVYELHAAVFNACGHYFDTLFVSVDSTAMGMSDISIEHGVEVYPNPAKDMVQLRSLYEMSSVTIYNGLGAEVLLQKVTGKEVELNIGAVCHRGIYFTKVITTDNKEFYTKLLIE